MDYVTRVPRRALAPRTFSILLGAILVMALVCSASAWAAPARLHLPEMTEERFPGTREEAFHYYTFDYSVPLVQQEEQRFISPSGRWAPIMGGSVTGWFRDILYPSVSPLLAPGIPSLEARFMQDDWFDATSRNVPEPIAEHIRDALQDAPAVFECVYQRREHIMPITFRRAMTGIHLERAIIAFWTEAPPEALTPARLREFDASVSGASPLIMIGPPVDACPETLGAALESVASNAPDLVPATEPGFGEAVMQGFTGRNSEIGDRPRLPHLLSS